MTLRSRGRGRPRPGGGERVKPEGGERVRSHRPPAAGPGLAVALLAVALVAVALVAFAVAAEASGASSAGEPLVIQRTSLTQDGPQLVWQTRLDHTFAPVLLEKNRRSLCLLIERVQSGSVSGVLCVDATRDPKQPELVYQRVTVHGRGPGKRIGARFSRADRTELTVRFDPADFGLAWAPTRWQTLSTLSSEACGPKPCTTLSPARPALARLRTPTAVGCIPSGAPFVTNGSRNVREVALTFDDGPWPDTPQFLDILEREHVPATFFQVGIHVASYGPAVDKRMLADGDVIGDHTWNHADVAGDGPFGAWEISRTAAAIRNLTGFTPCLFRAPGGAVSSALIEEARRMGFTTIQWDVDPSDWARPGTSAIYDNVVGHAQNGSIILQHDGGGDRSETLAALPHEIETLRSRGFTFVTVTQLLGQRLIYK